MTKSELAAQKCADLGNEVSCERKYYPNYKTVHFAADSAHPSNIAFRRYVEHVSDLCEQAIASGDTSGLEKLVLREPVDPDLLEARKICAEAGPWPATYIEGRYDDWFIIRAVMAALRRGREIERGEGK